MLVISFSVLLGFLLAWGVFEFRPVRKLLLSRDPPEQPSSPPLLPAAEGDEAKVEEWKKVFCDTVIAADGGLSPAMVLFLGAREQLLKYERQAAQTEAARDATRRPWLDGAAYVEFQMDMNASQSNLERFEVIRRWHGKGFRFPLSLRKSLLNGSADESTRNSLRCMFDEQDRPVELEEKQS